jgi:hypothetical protein
MGREMMWRAQVEDSPAAGFPVPQVDTSRPHSARMYDYFLGSHFL